MSWYEDTTEHKTRMFFPWHSHQSRTDIPHSLYFVLGWCHQLSNWSCSKLFCAELPRESFPTSVTTYVHWVKSSIQQDSFRFQKGLCCSLCGNHPLFPSARGVSFEEFPIFRSMCSRSTAGSSTGETGSESLLRVRLWSKAHEGKRPPEQTAWRARLWRAGPQALGLDPRGRPCPCASQDLLLQFCPQACPLARIFPILLVL